jgi:hypothetical protein
MRRGWWDWVARQMASFTDVVCWLHGPMVFAPGQSLRVELTVRAAA